MNAPRLDVLLAATRIDDIAAKHPELFDTKRRAPEILKRGALLAVGGLLGCLAAHFIFGTASNPFPVISGMLLAAAFVYFDPPPVMATRTLKASADEAQSAETAKTGSVHEHATAEGGDAQTTSHGPEGS